MKSNIVLYLALLISLTSCNGQVTSKEITKNDSAAIIDITNVERVEELGKNIMLVYQDKKSNYWFGSWEDGLYKYDGQKILHFTTQNGFPNNRIDEIKEDRSGNVYFNTSSGIIKYDGANFCILKISELDNKWKLEADDLWFKDGWNSGYVYRYDGDLLYKLPLPKTSLGEEYILENPDNPNPYTVYSIYKDRKENIWFGTGALGAFRYNGKSFDWILEKDVVEIYNEPTEGSNGVRSIIEDNDGYFWFNSKFRYNVYNKKNNNADGIFYSREKSVGSLDGKVDGNLYEYLSIAKENKNTLFIATYDAGVYRYDGKNSKHFALKDGATQIKLFSIYKDNDGKLWLGTPENGAYVYNEQAFEKFQPKHN